MSDDRGPDERKPAFSFGINFVGVWRAFHAWRMRRKLDREKERRLRAWRKRN
jgi:hypothetical protein